MKEGSGQRLKNYYAGKLFGLWREYNRSTMKTTLQNRRGMSWLLIFVFLLMGTTSNGSWQCLDGKPCDIACKMHLGESIHPTASSGSELPLCSHCLPATALMRSSASGNSDCSCSSPQCVLRVSEHPASTLLEGVKFFAPLLALPPPAITIVFPVTVKTTPVVATNYLCFYPQRFLRPTSGRAPPALL